MLEWGLSCGGALTGLHSRLVDEAAAQDPEAGVQMELFEDPAPAPAVDPAKQQQQWADTPL